MNNLLDQLSTLRERQVIRDIDLELCRFLQEQHPEISENVMLAAGLTSYLYRQGDVCLLLKKYASQYVFEEVGDAENIKAPDLECWQQVLSESPVVGSPGDFKPLILNDGGRLYLHKLWQYENNLAEQLIKRAQQQSSNIDLELLQDGLQRLFGDTSQEVDWQKVAAALSVRNKLSIISGGPGTGKTSTIVRVLALLLEQASQDERKPSIALTAPTGKAAARLKESILTAKEDLNISEKIRSAIPDEAMTLHQLLGARKHTSSFKHNEENPVPYDVVIVDEASMVDQALMSKLIGALLEDTRLVLLGDKDQLASVEAGSVLGDICDVNGNQFSKKMPDWFDQLSVDIPDDCFAGNPRPLTDNITLLAKSYRFGEESGIGQLATGIKGGDTECMLEVLKSSDFEDVSLNEVENLSALEKLMERHVTGYFNEIIQSNSVDEALRVFNQFRILAAHRRGPWGVGYLNQLIEDTLQQEGSIPKYKRWYPGKPIIVTVNDYSLGLHNGDTGVCLPDEEGELKVYFRSEDSIRAIAPGRLPEHNAAFAMTVHKSQGSEFDKVLLVLPNRSSKVLSRELIYTAVTRARTTMNIIGDEIVLEKAVNKQIQRSSGLRDLLWS